MQERECPYPHFSGEMDHAARVDSQRYRDPITAGRKMSHAVTMKSGLGCIITALLQMSFEGLQRVAGAHGQCGKVREGACMVYDCLQTFEEACDLSGRLRESN